MRLRNPRGLDPTLSDVLQQALRDDHDVALALDENGFLAIDVDDMRLVEGLAWETYDYPLHGGYWSDDERAVIDDLLRRRERFYNERRERRLETSNHAAAEMGEYDG